MWKEYQVTSILIFLIFATQITSDRILHNNNVICENVDKDQLIDLLSAMQEKDPKTLIHLGAYQQTPSNNFPPHLMLQPPNSRPYPNFYEDKKFLHYYRPPQFNSIGFPGRSIKPQLGNYQDLNAEYSPKFNHFHEIQKGHALNVFYMLKNSEYNIRDQPYFNSLRQGFPGPSSNLQEGKFPYKIEFPSEASKNPKGPNVEVLKALAYALPPEITTYHPTHFAKQYLMNTKPRATEKESLTEELDQEYDNQDYQENTADPIQNELQISENKNNSQDQYFRHNTQPVTFDNDELDGQELMKEPNQVEIIRVKSQVIEQPNNENNEDLDTAPSDNNNHIKVSTIERE